MLAFPFRVLPNGRVAQVEDDSDESAAQELALLLLTRTGERPLIPDYGTTDPAYDTTGATRDDVIAAVSAFVPDVEVVDVTQTSAQGQLTVEITFAR